MSIAGPESCRHIFTFLTDRRRRRECDLSLRFTAAVQEVRRLTRTCLGLFFTALVRLLCGENKKQFVYVNYSLVQYKAYGFPNQPWFGPHHCWRSEMQAGFCYPFTLIGITEVRSKKSIYNRHT